MSKGLTNGIIAIGGVGDIDLTKVYATSKQAVDIYVPTTRQTYSKYTSGATTVIPHSLGIPPTRVAVVRTDGYPSPFNTREIVACLFSATYSNLGKTLNMSGFPFLSMSLTEEEVVNRAYAPLSINQNSIIYCENQMSDTITIRGSGSISDEPFLEAGTEYTIITMAE